MRKSIEFQPRLATFTSFQGQNDGTDLRELIKTQLAKKDYLEAFNLAGNVINSEAKSKGKFSQVHWHYT